MTESLASVMESLPGRLRDERLAGWSSCFHFSLRGDGGGEWTVRVGDGRCTVEPGAPALPDCTVEMRAETLLGIVAGRLNPQVAFMMGKVKVSNIAAMMRFIKALRPTREDGDEEEQDAVPEAAPQPPRRGPLAGTTVVDVSRMLPGAVLVRMLLDLGARVIKIEDPAGGDPLRNTLPRVDGVGVGFATFFRGCESLAVDLRDEAGAETLRRLARHADVLIESFSPATLEGWGVGVERLRSINPALVVCSLSGYARHSSWAQRPGHDLNFTGLSGLLFALGAEDAPPRVQVADVAGGLLASTAVLAALLQRRSSGRGCHVEQPLAAAPLPFMAWAWAETAIGGVGTSEALLAGRCPAYRTYRCADETHMAVAALEPKLWERLVTALGVQHLAGVGLDRGPGGVAAAEEIAKLLGTRPREEWLALLEAAGVPASPLHTLADALAEPYFSETGAVVSLPDKQGELHLAAGSFVPAFAAATTGAVPKLGENTQTVLREFGLTS